MRRFYLGCLKVIGKSWGAVAIIETGKFSLRQRKSQIGNSS
jgi:hypothetical protein